MSRLVICAVFLALVAALAAACDDGGGNRRVIRITQTDDGCSPASVALQTGEKVRFEVKNEGDDDREVEGIEGTNLDEVIVPSGRTRNVDYTAPSREGTQKIKCYTPGGNSTIIEIKVSGPAGAAPDGSAPEVANGQSLVTTSTPKESISVDLASFKVTSDRATASSGPVKFTAHNVDPTAVHELAVLRVKPGGGYQNAGEVEDIDPLKSGEVVLDLPAGKYLLACLIAPGEHGSKTDHFQEGMRLDFTVS
jgi:uncharacterized cupredoxin-like copper-binding protein